MRGGSCERSVRVAGSSSTAMSDAVEAVSSSPSVVAAVPRPRLPPLLAERQRRGGQQHVAAAAADAAADAVAAFYLRLQQEQQQEQQQLTAHPPSARSLRVEAWFGSTRERSVREDERECGVSPRQQW